MIFENILLEKQEKINIITINRPESLNALNGKTIKEISGALDISENAKLGLPEVTLGLIPGYGGTQRLPKLVGKGIANEMIFSAKMISAERAKEIGLVNEVYSIEDLLPKTIELASLISKNSSQAISKAITAVNASDYQNGYELEIKFFGELFDMEDKKEGISAFINKRKPNF